MLVRILKYAQNYGIRATAKHVLHRAFRSVIPPMRQVYCAHVAEIPPPSGSEDPSVKVRSFLSMDEIPPPVLEEILSSGTIDDQRPYSRAMVTSSLNWLFSQGGVFWTCFEGPRLVGYLWTIRGSQKEPRYHFVPLGVRDVVFLAHEIFPAYRGRELNRKMTHLVISEMKALGIERVYVDVELSNSRSLKSFSKTVFSPIGLARMKKFKNRQIVIWAHPKRSVAASSIPKD